jgi:hypothetical protein
MFIFADGGMKLKLKFTLIAVDFNGNKGKYHVYLSEYQTRLCGILKAHTIWYRKCEQRTFRPEKSNKFLMVTVT